MGKPWYKTTRRWMQTNLTETDPLACDVDLWARQWDKNHIQGIIVNAGGIVAYYPSKNPLQYRAWTLGDRDLFKEFLDKAKEKGIAVLARMDVNRADEAFYKAHPDWFAVNREGKPYKTNDSRYFSCVNSGYYHSYIPGILQEIIELYHPQGFTDNSWAGMRMDKICYCPSCREKFKAQEGLELPEAVNFEDPVYRRWVRWSYGCRTDIWDLFNSVTRKYGGEDCLWLGMMNVNPAEPYFCDLVEIGKRSPIVMSDYQSRDDLNGFEQNGIYGGVLSNLTGYDKIHPESMANYVRGRRVFRLSATPAEEVSLWLMEGMSGQLSPWLHYVGGCPEDERELDNCTEVMDFHLDNEKYLYDRTPAANVALLWSQENSTFYGKDAVKKRMELPWRGFTRALINGRIPFQPVNAHLLEQSMEDCKVVILPDLAVITDSQAAALEKFVLGGGSLVYTGASGFLNEDGELRKEPFLDSITGISRRGGGIQPLLCQGADWMDQSRHSYMRLTDKKHPVMKGFEKTQILPFGGILYEIKSVPEKFKTLLTFIPPFPIYPPELSCMGVTHTDTPVVIAGETGFGGRLVYFAGDVDRLCGEVNHPDHLRLLEQAVRYAADGELPLSVEGAGYLDAKLYNQACAKVLHLINLSGANETPAYVTGYLPVYGIKVQAACREFVPSTVMARVSGQELPFQIKDDRVEFILPVLKSQELIVIE